MTNQFQTPGTDPATDDGPIPVESKVETDKDQHFNRGFECGYQRGLDDYGDDRTDNSDVLRMQALEENKAAFGYNVELSAWGFEYESPWFPTLRELADWLIAEAAQQKGGEG